MTTRSIKRSRTGNYYTYRNALVGNTTYSPGVIITGGMLSSDSTYYYRVFTASGTLTISNGNLTADILVVAGGGGGGSNHAGGGGGAGGLQGFASQSLISGSYTITVGSGGVGGGGTNGVGTNGTNSQFGALTASVGGGGGGSEVTGAVSSTGGSGGGGSGTYWKGLGSAGTTGQGSKGGDGSGTNSGSSGAADYGGGGGGGGATAIGANGSGNNVGANGGNGGAGDASYASWATATGTSSGGYAGGGGGGSWSTTSSSGGIGGGGAGGNTNVGEGTAGLISSGGGGGGSAASAVTGHSRTGGNGGSGIVIIRYLKSAVTAYQADFELIGTVILTSTQATVTFNGIPQDYKHLQLRYVSRNDNAGGVGNQTLRFNNDSAANYSWHELYGGGTSVGSGSSASATSIGATWDSGNALPSNVFVAGITDILDYTSTSKYKTVRGFSGLASSSGGQGAKLGSGSWRNTAAITSISVAPFGGNYVSGSRFSLYGVRG
jgi:hypothetical protein